MQVPVILLDAVRRVVRAEDDGADDCTELLGDERGDAGKDCQVSDFGQRGEAEAISERFGEGDNARIRVESPRLDPRHCASYGAARAKAEERCGGEEMRFQCRKPMQGRERCRRVEETRQRNLPGTRVLPSSQVSVRVQTDLCWKMTPSHHDVDAPFAFIAQLCLAHIYPYRLQLERWLPS